MVMLGDLLAAARDAAGRFEVWLERCDPELAKEATAAGRECGLGLGAYARMAVADFSQLASGEDWATLISNLRTSADPGSVCLAAMIRWRLAAKECKHR